MRYVVSVDAGGTFSDAVILDEQGNIVIGKVPSTPHNPAFGIIEAVKVAAENMGSDLETVVKLCALFVCGTTVTTNAMLQRKGAKTGLLITKGFEDTLVIGRVKARTAGLEEAKVTNVQRADRVPPVVPVTLTRGITERIDYLGRIICPLDLDEVEAKVKELVAEGIEALAVCLLWSFKNPTHERLIWDLVVKKYPSLFVTVSSDLVPVIQEYERANTVALNCFLGLKLRDYLSELESALKRRGYKGELLIMQSIGGLAPSGQIQKVPITTLCSGPVGGMVASQKLGECLGEKNIITTDMGGTSTDVGLIVDGVFQVNPSPVIERELLLIPAVEITSIGAGCGSIAWLDEVMGLRVGPQSQGAVPGPACYDLGGDLATVTDADVVLGYINTEHFLGGTAKISKDKAVAAIQANIADPLGMSVTEAALGIHNIVNAHMADLIRKVTVERGFDPRNFTLFAYGGGGPTHCTAFGPDIGVKKIVIPSTATVFSALGLAQSDIRHFYSRTFLTTVPRTFEIDHVQIQEFNEILAELLANAREQLAKDGIPEERWLLQPSIDMRYRGQIHEIMVPVTTQRELDAAAIKVLCTEFARRYEMLYGAGSSSQLAAIELVNIRVDAIGTAPFRYEPIKYALAGDDPSPAYTGTRKVYWPGKNSFVNTRTYRGEKLGAGNVIRGPAVLEFYGTTVPVHPGQTATVDEFLNLVLAKE